MGLIFNTFMKLLPFESVSNKKLIMSHSVNNDVRDYILNRLNFSEDLKLQIEDIEKKEPKTVNLLIKSAFHSNTYPDLFQHICYNVFLSNREIFCLSLKQAITLGLSHLFIKVYDHLMCDESLPLHDVQFTFLQMAYETANEDIIDKLSRSSVIISEKELFKLLIAVSSLSENKPARLKVFTQLWEKINSITSLNKIEWLRLMYTIARDGFVDLVNISVERLSQNKAKLKWAAMFYALLYGRSDFIKSVMENLTPEELKFGRKFRSPNLNIDFLTVSITIHSGKKIVKLLRRYDIFTRKEIEDICVEFRRRSLLEALEFNKEIDESKDYVCSKCPPKGLQERTVFNKKFEDQMPSVDINQETLTKTQIESYFLPVPCTVQRNNHKLRNLTEDLSFCESECDNCCQRLNRSLRFLQFVQNRLGKGCLKLFGSVPKGTKIWQYNECDLQCEMEGDGNEEEPVEFRKNFLKLMDSVLMDFETNGTSNLPKVELFLSKSGACLLQKDLIDNQCNSYDFIPVVPVGNVDCVSKMRETVHYLRKTKPCGWIKQFDWILLDCHFQYENPFIVKKQVPALKMTKFVEFCGDNTIHINRYFSEEVEPIFYQGYNRDLICSIKIITKLAEIEGVKSYTIENVFRSQSKSVSGFADQDIYSITQNPSLKRNFESRIDYLEWKDDIMNPENSREIDYYEVPLITHC